MFKFRKAGEGVGWGVGEALLMLAAAGVGLLVVAEGLLLPALKARLFWVSTYTRFSSLRVLLYSRIVSKDSYCLGAISSTYFL